MRASKQQNKNRELLIRVGGSPMTVHQGLRRILAQTDSLRLREAARRSRRLWRRVRYAVLFVILAIAAVVAVSSNYM